MSHTVLELDHLVLAARTLTEGLDWCETTLGLRPEAGGRHDFMGTHNRVFPIGSAAFPRAYLEIIAIDPEARPPKHPRWFDLDAAGLQRTLATRGPQLGHWVARCDSIDAAGAAFAASGIDCGEIRPAERVTPAGLLRWRIGIRTDGRRPLGGAAPALIEWGAVHPTDSMQSSGVVLQALQVGRWPAALAGWLPAGVGNDDRADALPLRAVLTGPRGRVVLECRPPEA